MKQHIKIDRKDDIIAIEAAIAWNYAVEPVSKRIIAVCVPLNITLELDSDDELLTSIQSSMDAFFGSLIEGGALESFLKARGWLPPAANIPPHAVVKTPQLSVQRISIDDLSLAAPC